MHILSSINSSRISEDFKLGYQCIVNTMKPSESNTDLLMLKYFIDGFRGFSVMIFRPETVFSI